MLFRSINLVLSIWSNLKSLRKGWFWSCIVVEKIERAENLSYCNSKPMNRWHLKSLSTSSKNWQTYKLAKSWCYVRLASMTSLLLLSTLPSSFKLWSLHFLRWDARIGLPRRLDPRQWRAVGVSCRFKPPRHRFSDSVTQ